MQETKNKTQMTPENSSQALIDKFLADTGGDVVTEAASDFGQAEQALPDGHQSGFIAVIGRPNVGKSTLVNAMIGHKVSIVSHKPQTTRTRVSGILTEATYQLIFIDTPGIHKKPAYKLNKLMIEQAVSTIPDADVILFVVDVSVAPRDEDEMIARILKEKAQTRPVIFAMNKMDKLAMKKAQSHIEQYWALFPDYTDSIPTSALEEQNIELLRDHILEHVPQGPRYYPHNQITDQLEHQIAAELIREAMLPQIHQEVPYAIAILIEDYSERENGVFYISARIWVERESQKPIIIGKNGQRLKKIGSAARAELERFIGGKVFLDLWVKVKPKWRDQDARLRELGF